MAIATDVAPARLTWKALAPWAVVVVPTWLVLVLGTYWEPVVRDSWGHVWWHHATDVSLYEFAKDTYLHNNPRIGQVLTWLLFAPGPWHVIVTPLVELALFYLLATLALGRWPTLRRADDALAIATIAAMVLATCPLVGPMFFYRPFSGNYLYGFVLSLAFLAPYRVHAARMDAGDAATRSPRWLAPAIPVLGLAAGLANEHTGPTVGALTLLAIFACRRRLQPWMLAGLAGFVAGSLALLFAPGQDLRYEGLATQQSLLQRIAARGADNLDIITIFFRYVRSLAFWLALGGGGYWFARKRPPRAAWFLVAAGLTVTLTLLASPKQGPRLYLASIAFASAGVAGLVLPQLTTTWSRALAWGLAAVMAGRVMLKLVTVYAEVGPEGHDRIAKIMNAPKGSTLTLQPYTQPRSRWFMGDDFVHQKWRRHVAEGFGLAKIELEGATADPAADPDP